MLDSGFCVFQALITLIATSNIKKNHFWLQYVASNTNNVHMVSTKEIGGTNSICGTLENVPYNIFSMYKPYFIMKIIPTYDFF